MCVCVCVCVCARARARVHARVKSGHKPYGQCDCRTHSSSDQAPSKIGFFSPSSVLSFQSPPSPCQIQNVKYNKSLQQTILCAALREAGERPPEAGESCLACYTCVSVRLSCLGQYLAGVHLLCHGGYTCLSSSFMS